LNVESWNHYVPAVIALFAVMLYVMLLIAGFTNFIFRMRKRTARWKRSKKAQRTRRLWNMKSLNDEIMKKSSLNIDRNAVAIALAAITLIAATALLSGRGRFASADAPRAASSTSAKSDATIESASQLNAIKVKPVGTYLFPVEKESVGDISFADDLTVDVFPAYQGTIIKVFVELGTQALLSSGHGYQETRHKQRSRNRADARRL
jgi:hypothetical protein